ncbi:bifunctional riboflavin kinase/FAD synthetase [Blattabacterium cuenoti]|uniref:bifunctional riboflavin kinase/FAD synthetase n=1 Tax=Blattabacterium cuenoti TaxID=1653831 RepID=UPI00163BA8E7|nr:bifunctional riboflavin kinase/FAD synthetase [Blattabacterium cuenoti]
MKIYSFIDEFHCLHPCVFTIGIFDGVHMGHQKIIKNLISESEKKYCSVLLTFVPHPKEILNPYKKFYYLNTLYERIKNIQKLGLNHLIIHPFTEKFSKLSIKDFFKKIFHSNIYIKKIIIGYDFHIGKNKYSSLNTLRYLSKIYGIKILQILPYQLDNQIISSTKIRNSLILGDLNWANKALGYYYTLSGNIIKGRGIGKFINFPTSNIKINTNKLIPKKGVYAVKIRYNNTIYNGMLNIGINPTINHNKKIKIETNIFNFHKNIYGEKIDIFIIKMIREEKKFRSIKELKNQIIKDEIYIKNFFIVKKLNNNNFK